jgi:protein SCO1/2
MDWKSLRSRALLTVVVQAFWLPLATAAIAVNENAQDSLVLAHSGEASTPAKDTDGLNGRGGDFTLSSPGGPLSLSDLRGKVVLVFFGYTSCPDVCPLSLAKINACLSAMDPDEAERVRGLFITLDPQRDSVQALEKYTGYFHRNIVGLTDRAENIDAVARKYGVSYERTATPGAGLGYSISHPTDILIIDPDGALVGTVAHDTDADTLLRRVRGLLKPAGG